MMRERIKRIIEEKGLKASSFADKINVSRGAISHILGENGRKNEPSKSTIDKILKTFPDISPLWFLNGEGPMYKREQIFMPSALQPMQPDLFDEKITVESSKKSHEPEYSLKDENKKSENIINSTIIQDINLSNNISKKIDKIIIFFNDKTFMTFISEE